MTLLEDKLVELIEKYPNMRMVSTSTGEGVLLQGDLESRESIWIFRFDFARFTSTLQNPCKLICEIFALAQMELSGRKSFPSPYLLSPSYESGVRGKIDVTVKAFDCFYEKLKLAHASYHYSAFL